MQAVGVVAEIQRPLQLAFPSAPYNISLNLTSILSFLPSRLLVNSGLLAHFRKRWEHVVDLAGSGAEQLTEETGWAAAESLLNIAPVNTIASQVPPPQATGPWAFFTSGYMLGLFIMVILLHRIQNIIIPSRLPPSRRARSGVTTGLRRAAVWNRFSFTLLPLDLSKTTIRLVIHLPSLYFLSKMLLCWFIMVLQTSDLYPIKSDFSWVKSLGIWVEEQQMSEICWKTFCAVCIAFSVEGFVKALDGIEAGFPIGSNMNPNTSPFNIIGYAFLLHLYSSPLAQLPSSTGLPSRPDKHAIITVAIPLLQLTIFHALSISKRFSSHRLLPTVLSSFLSLIHFHGALASHFYKINPNHQLEEPQARILTAYPILNYIPNIFETLLLLTIFLTIVLNVIVQLVVRGRVDRVFSGLGITTSHIEDDGHVNHGGRVRAFFRNLPYEEDFGVLLLRIGTASLEATGLRGWSNEVAPIPAPLRRRRRGGRGQAARERLSTSTQAEYGSIRMGRVAAGGVQSGYKASSSSVGTSVSTARWRKGKMSSVQGIRNEVRHVDLGVESASGQSGRENENGWWRWAKEVARYGGAMWATLKGLVVLLWSRMLDMARNRRRGKAGVRRVRLEMPRRLVEDQEEDTGGDDEEGDTSTAERDAEVYQRFLRGEMISDDEGDEDGGSELWAEDNIHEEEEEDTGVSDDVNGEDEAIALFTDMLRSGNFGSIRGDVVLAHLVDDSTPLTRSRWRFLSTGGFGSSRKPEENEADDWEEEEFEEDNDQFKKNYEIEARNLCVICTTEARDIICWPCRCLAMCDGCREALASRSTPAKHRCPCCRQIIEGYSKIYIP